MAGIKRASTDSLQRSISPLKVESPHSQAEHHLTQSVTLLRQAGQQDHLLPGLLHRAPLWREMLSFNRVPCGPRVSDDTAPQTRGPLGTRLNDQELLANAERDLSEAETIAKRDSMLIWQIEAALERTQLYLTLAETDVGRTLLPSRHRRARVPVLRIAGSKWLARNWTKQNASSNKPKNRTSQRSGLARLGTTRIHRRFQRRRNNRLPMPQRRHRIS